MDVLGQKILISTHNNQRLAEQELTRKRSGSFSIFAPQEKCSDVLYRQKKEDLASHSQAINNSNQLRLFKKKKQPSVEAPPAYHGEIKASSVS